MKQVFTKKDAVAYVRRFDKRSKDLSNEEIDDIIVAAFGELTSLKFPFQGELIVELKPFVDSGEDRLTVDIQEDVVSIFDLYLTLEENNTSLIKKDYVHGIPVFRDGQTPLGYQQEKSILYVDDFEVGRVHLNLETMPSSSLNLVLKYFYVPSATFTEIFISSLGLRAIQYALGVSMYDYMHDVERSMQKLTALKRIVKDNFDDSPISEESQKPSMFPAGV